MIRRPPRSTRKESSAASDVYKRQHPGFIERIASLEEFVDKYDLNKEMRGFKPYKWTWSYDSKSKLLKFKPEPSDN